MAKYDIAILTSYFEIGLFQKGMGYRFWEFAQTLADSGMKALIIAPNSSKFIHPNVKILIRDSLSIGKISELSEVFVFCLHEDVSLVSNLRKKDKLLIYDSVLTPIEGLNFQKTLDMKDKKDKNEFFQALVKKHRFFNRISDYYLVGTEQEKLLKIGELLGSNSIDYKDYNTLANLIVLLPVCGFNRHSTQIKLSKKTNNLVLWNGGLWNHYNYSPLIDSVVKLRNAGFEIKLRFMYKNSTRIYEQIRACIKRERLENIVEIPKPDEQNPDFFEKQLIINKSRTLVLLNEHTLLSEMVLPMRLREALLFEKPMIVSDFGVLGSFVKKHKIGITVQNSMVDISNALKVMFENKRVFSTYKENIRKIREDFYYENFVTQIIKFIKNSRLKRQ
ncbi:MAG: hypothetical protein Q8P26_01285 [Candidatus Levybacteria bacterium]|nr:hypothetical protein [Candidatus Levybacteria bacterium]